MLLQQIFLSLIHSLACCQGNLCEHPPNRPLFSDDVTNKIIVHESLSQMQKSINVLNQFLDNLEVLRECINNFRLKLFAKTFMH